MWRAALTIAFLLVLFALLRSGSDRLGAPSAGVSVALGRSHIFSRVPTRAINIESQNIRTTGDLELSVQVLVCFVLLRS